MRGAWLLAVVLAGCAKVEAFVCEGDQQCVDGANAGACEKSGFCSFPDAGCPGGKRYGEYAGDQLAGTCVEGGDTGDTSGGACAEGCGPCEACVAGSCEAKPAGEACEVQCEAYVFGPGEEAGRTTCLASASGAGSGTCDGEGACGLAAGACAAAGAEIAGCDVACARADHNCTPGAPVESVTVASLCTTGAPTDGCKPACTDAMGGPSQLTPRACDASGTCATGQTSSCGGYTCAASLDACRTTCEKQSECAMNFMCTMDGLCE